jgi:hypothetical protein
MKAGAWEMVPIPYSHLLALTSNLFPTPDSSSTYGRLGMTENAP